MPWDPLINSEILAIHAALVPTDDGGEVIYFGGDQHHAAFNLANNLDAARRFPCRPGPGQHPLYVRAPTTDVFCSGHTLLADGRLLVAGGTQLFPADAVGGGHGHGEANHFPGHRHCWIYDPHARSFAQVAPLNPEIGRPPAADDIPGGGRWYPTLTMLPSGEVFIYAGHARNDDTRHNIGAGERYRPISNSWVMLAPTAGAGAGAPDLYPRLFLLKGGQVLALSRLAGFTRCARFDAYTGNGVDTIVLPPDGFYHGFEAPAVMLPLLPDDQYRMRLMVCGGQEAHRINLEPPAPRTPAWHRAGARHGSAAGALRHYANAVLLPDGRVLLTGGVRTTGAGSDATAVLTPEIYTPAIDWNSGTYLDIANENDESDRWDTLEEPTAVPRNYHSTALLMPDARVWTAGSSKNGAPGDPATAGQLQIQIFQPPYPAGPRPRITSAPRVVAYGQQFVITSAGGNIRRIVLMRCGSTTHAFDCGQRYVGLRFDSAGPDRWVATAPPSGDIAPPGPYLLFLVDDAGRPCEYASFVRVGGEVYAFTDRSIVSRDEVGVGAIVENAFYVVFDGYRPDEIDLRSTDMSCRWDDGNAVVPGVQARVDDVRREASSTGVAQRITFVCSLRFTNNSAFGSLGGANQRRMRVDIRKNGAATAVQIHLYRDAVPYMRDGNTPWLSIDLRVVRRRVGDRLAGVEQQDHLFLPGVAANGFIAGVLDEFHLRPSGDTHPFNTQLDPDDGSAGQLALGSHEGGRRVFNYAFAKVRFRAPAGVTSSQLRMLFRLFNTTTPSVAYNPVTLYRRTGDGASATPLFYDFAGEPVLSPCFAAPRDPLTRLAGADPLNTRTMAGAGTQEQIAYFGCWLDMNHADAIRTRLRGDHQCVIAELHVQGVSIPFGATPSDSSLLAQRNVAYVASDNPGFTAATHTVQHSFELHPVGRPRGHIAPALHTLRQLPTGHVQDVEPHALHLHANAPMRLGAGELAAHVDALPEQGPEHEGMPVVASVSANVGAGPDSFQDDELLFSWNGLPADTVVSIFLPDVDLDALLEVAAQRPAPALYERLDDHTLRLRVLGEVSYLPLPPGRTSPIPGLLSVQLPFGVRAGRRWRITVQHICGVSRRIIGAFELNVPVRTGGQLLTTERRRLAALRLMRDGLAAGSRWVPIFERYVKQVEDRVRDFGARPEDVPASPYGAPEDWPADVGHDSGAPPAGGEPGHACNGGDGGVPRRCDVLHGRVQEVLFDCCGDLEGFVLGTCDDRRHVRTRGAGLAALLTRACREGLTLEVTLDAGPCGVRHVRVVCGC